MTQSILHPFVIAENRTLRGRCIIEGLSLVCFNLEIRHFLSICGPQGPSAR